MVETTDQGMRTLFFSKLWWLEASLPLPVWCGISWEPGQSHYPLRKLCALCHLIPELSPVSLSIFSLRAQGTALCFTRLARCLFGLLVWDRLSWETLTDSHTVISLLLQSRLTACLPATAFLSTTAQHTQGTRHIELFWSQNNRKSMEWGFLPPERERWSRKVPPKAL